VVLKNRTFRLLISYSIPGIGKKGRPAALDAELPGPGVFSRDNMKKNQKSNIFLDFWAKRVYKGINP
jgi:hypothetical protein